MNAPGSPSPKRRDQRMRGVWRFYGIYLTFMVSATIGCMLILQLSLTMSLLIGVPVGGLCVAFYIIMYQRLSKRLVRPANRP